MLLLEEPGESLTVDSGIPLTDLTIGHYLKGARVTATLRKIHRDGRRQNIEYEVTYYQPHHDSEATDFSETKRQKSVEQSEDDIEKNTFPVIFKSQFFPETLYKNLRRIFVSTNVEEAEDILVVQGIAEENVGMTAGEQEEGAVLVTDARVEAPEGGAEGQEDDESSDKGGKDKDRSRTDRFADGWSDDEEEDHEDADEADFEFVPDAGASGFLKPKPAAEPAVVVAPPPPVKSQAHIEVSREAIEARLQLAEPGTSKVLKLDRDAARAYWSMAVVHVGCFFF